MFRSIFVMVIFFSLIVQSSWAGNTKPSVTEQVNKVNIFNRMTDYWGTLEKNDIEKANIIQQRKEERRVKRLQSLQRKKQQEQRRREEKITQDMKRIKGLR